jgi:nickel-dependent lactate racemase
MYLGKTGRGTPVFVNKIFCESDIRMVVGNIEPHHFQGYSGGAKSASIGLAGRKTINHNHSMLAHSKSVLGEYSQNPCRQDVEEIGDLIGIHFAYNIVMNGDKKIVEAICGDPREVMEKGIPIAKMVYETSVATHYDLVIASVGGYPKDINLYQSQKALAHSARVVKDGGTIIIAAECREGIGSHSFEAFMEGVTSFAQVFEKLNSEGFRVGPHKALLIARDAMKANVILVSDMDPVNVKRFLLNSSPSVQTAVDQVVHSLSPSSRIAVLPKAASTIPALS